MVSNFDGKSEVELVVAAKEQLRKGGELVRKAIHHVWEAGRILSHLKEHVVPKRAWKKWLETNKIPSSSAYRAMNFYGAYPDLSAIEHMSVTEAEDRLKAPQKKKVPSDNKAAGFGEVDMSQMRSEYRRLFSPLSKFVLLLTETDGLTDDEIDRLDDQLMLAQAKLREARSKKSAA